MSTLCCARHATRGVPLYAPDGQTRQASEVAQLIGDFATIDGQDVSRSGQRFELLPGCHVVVPRATGTKQRGSGQTRMSSPLLKFAISMAANRKYVIEYALAERTGRGGSPEYVAEEQDPFGAFIAALNPTQDPDELEACRR